MTTFTARPFGERKATLAGEPMRTRSRSIALVGTFLALGSMGCSGGGLNTVKGKVLYKDQPLAGALVSFHPKGTNDPNVVRPTAFTLDDGTFTVMTGEKEGALAGEYVVTIICTATKEPKGGKKRISFGTDDDTFDRLGGAFANVANSKIEVTINSGDNQLDPWNLQ